MCILRSQSRLCTRKQRATRDKGGMIGGAVAAADKHPKDKGREGKEEEVEEVTGTEEVVEEECKLKGRESQEEERQGPSLTWLCILARSHHSCCEWVQK